MMQKDTYKSTGCFDLTCKGFVQTNKNIALGATLGPVSIPSHQQYEINVGIFRVMITCMCVLIHIFQLTILITQRLIVTFDQGECSF